MNQYLVGELGVNLAGVRRLLSVVEVVERLDLLSSEDALTRRGERQCLVREGWHLREILGLA